MHITPVGGNVFADLGFAQEDAANMRAESQRIIAKKRSGMGCLMAEPNESRRSNPSKSELLSATLPGTPFEKD